MNSIGINKLNNSKRAPKKIEVRYIESENNGAVDVFIDMVKPELLKPVSEEEANAILERHQGSHYNIRKEQYD